MSKLSLFSRIKSPKINNDYLGEVNGLVKDLLKNSFEMKEMSLSDMIGEYRDAQKSLQDRDIKMRRGHRGTNDVMNNGLFKNQFETGKSDGYYSPSTRRQTESRAFGTQYDLDGKERPKYGYVDGGNASGYGDNIFTFKPSAKNNATFTLGDSLDDQLVGSRYGFADWTPVIDNVVIAKYGDNLVDELKDIKNTGLCDYGDIYAPRDASYWITRMKNATKEMKKPAPSMAYGDYHEVQFHGPLGIQDVEKLRLNDLDPQRIRDARRAAKEFGFRLEVPNKKTWDGRSPASDIDEYWKCIENCTE